LIKILQASKGPRERGKENQGDHKEAKKERSKVKVQRGKVILL